MDSLLRALSAAIRLWRAAVRPASSVGVVGALLHPAKPKAMLRAVTARIAREAERFLLAYIDPFLAKNTCTSKHSKPRNWYSIEAFALQFTGGRTGFSTLMQ
jgi:DNA-binding NarL/FixJ family response regulator